MLLRNDRTHLRGLIIGATHLELSGQLSHALYQPVRYPLLGHHHRQGHAALTRAAERGVDNSLGGSFQYRVVHDQGVVLGFA